MLIFTTRVTERIKCPFVPKMITAEAVPYPRVSVSPFLLIRTEDRTGHLRNLNTCKLKHSGSGARNNGRKRRFVYGENQPHLREEMI